MAKLRLFPYSKSCLWLPWASSLSPSRRCGWVCNRVQWRLCPRVHQHPWKLQVHVLRWLPLGTWWTQLSRWVCDVWRLAHCVCVSRPLSGRNILLHVPLKNSLSDRSSCLLAMPSDTLPMAVRHPCSNQALTQFGQGFSPRLISYNTEKLRNKWVNEWIPQKEVSLWRAQPWAESFGWAVSQAHFPLA